MSRFSADALTSNISQKEESHVSLNLLVNVSTVSIIEPQPIPKTSSSHGANSMGSTNTNYPVDSVHSAKQNHSEKESSISTMYERGSLRVTSAKAKDHNAAEEMSSSSDESSDEDVKGKFMYLEARSKQPESLRKACRGGTRLKLKWDKQKALRRAAAKKARTATNPSVRSMQSPKSSPGASSKLSSAVSSSESSMSSSTTSSSTNSKSSTKKSTDSCGRKKQRASTSGSVDAKLKKLRSVGQDCAKYDASRPNYLHCTTCNVDISIKGRGHSTFDFQQFDKHLATRKHKKRRLLQLPADLNVFTPMFRCQHYRPTEENWYILYSCSGGSALEIKPFDGTVRSTECLEFTVDPSGCCANCTAMPTRTDFRQKVSAMKRLVQEHGLPNPQSASKEKVILSLNKFLNEKHCEHSFRYKNFNEDLLDIMKDLGRYARKQKKNEIQMRSRSAKIKKQLKSLQNAVRSGDVEAMFAQMGSSFKLLSQCSNETDNEYITPLLKGLWSSLTRCLDAKSAKGFRRTEQERKVWFLFYQISPKGVRLWRELFGKALVPTKSGIHKPSKELRAEGVGILKSIIPVIRKICSDFEFTSDSQSASTIGTVAIHYDGTALNAVIQYVSSLDCLVGFADYWNAAEYLCDDYESIEKQFEERLVADDVLIFLWVPALPSMPVFPVAMFPISKGQYNHNDINFLQSKVIHALRSGGALGRLVVLGSNALSTQAAIVEAIAVPTQRLCSLPRDTCSKEHQQEISFPDSIVSTKCDGYGNHLLPALELGHVLKRNWRNVLRKAFFFGDCLVFPQVWADAVKRHHTNTLCSSVLNPSDYQDLQAAIAFVSASSRRALDGIKFNKGPLVYSWLGCMAYEMIHHLTMPILDRVRLAGVVRTVWQAVHQRQIRDKGRLCTRNLLPPKLILHNVLLCDSLIVYTLAHQRHYQDLPFCPARALETESEKYNSILRQVHVEFSMAMLVNHNANIVEYQRILNELKDQHRGNRMRQVLKMKGITAGDILQSIKEGAEVTAPIILKLLEIVPTASRTRAASSLLVQHLSRGPKWDYKESTPMRFEREGRNLCSDFRDGVEPSWLLIKSNSKSLNVPKERTQPDLVEESQQRDSPDSAIEFSDSVLRELRTEINEVERTGTLLDIAVQLSQSEQCKEPSSLPNGLPNQKESMPDTNHSTMLELQCFMTELQESNEIPPVQELQQKKADLEHHLKTAPHSSAVHSAICRAIETLEVCIGFVISKFTPSKLQKYASNVTPTARPFVSARRYCTVKGMGLMTKDAAAKKAAVAKGFQKTSWNRARPERVRRNGWVSKKTHYNFSPNVPLVEPGQKYLFVDLHKQKRFGKIVQIFYHSSSGVRAMKKCPLKQKSAMAMVEFILPGALALTVDQNKEMLRLLPLSNLDRQVHHIEDPSNLSEVSTESLMSLEEWKKELNALKEDFKDYKFDCERCGQRFVGPTWYSKHIAQCSVVKPPTHPFASIDASIAELITKNRGPKSKQTHYKSKARQFKYQCKQCKKPYKLFSWYQAHERTCKGISVKSSTSSVKKVVTANLRLQSASKCLKGSALSFVSAASSSVRNEQCFEVGDQEIQSMHRATLNGSSVEQRHRNLSFEHITLNQLISRRDQFRCLSRNVDFKVVRKSHCRNLSQCPLNKCPDLLPRSGDTSFRSVSWPFRTLQQGDGGVDIEREFGVDPTLRSSPVVETFYMLWIRNVGFFDKNVYVKLRTLVHSAGEAHAVVDSFDWFLERVQLWSDLPEPYKTLWKVSNAVDMASVKQHWKEVEKKLTQTVMVRHVKQGVEWAVENLPRLARTGWLHDREMTGFSQYLNLKQSMLKVLCLKSDLSSRWRTIEQLPYLMHRNRRRILAVHQEEVRLFCKHVVEVIDYLINEGKSKEQMCIDTILIPIHVPSHWVLGEIDFSNRKVSVRDSFPNHTEWNMANEANLFFHSMSRLIIRALHQQNLQHADAFNFTGGAELENWQWIHHNDILQWNGCDCGVFVNLMMEGRVDGSLADLKLENLDIYQHGRMHILDKLVM